MKRWRRVLYGMIALQAWALSSCSPADFVSSTVINGVRILASRASKPRAAPGDEVNVDLLAFDGRPNAKAPKLYWLPIGCVNPTNDAYYACFAKLAEGGGGGGVLLTGVDAGADSDSDADSGADSGADADAGAGLAGLLRPGVNLTKNSFLIAASSASFRMPENVIIPRNGVTPSYGLVILFNFACTNDDIELLPYDPNGGNPQQIPIGCFDSNHNQLGPDDFVFGFTRVYAYAEADQLTEMNPVIKGVDVGERDGGLGIDGGTTTKAVLRAPLRRRRRRLPASTPSGRWCRRRSRPASRSGPTSIRPPARSRPPPGSSMTRRSRSRSRAAPTTTSSPRAPLPGRRRRTSSGSSCTTTKAAPTGSRCRSK